MPFMKLYVQRGAAYIVETLHGSEIVPCDIVNDIGLEPGEHLDAEDADSRWLGAVQALRDFCQGEPLEIERTKMGWLGRYSAP